MIIVGQILTVSLFLVLAFSLRPGIHKEKHFVSNRCCKQKNGFICGSTFVDCCRSECEDGIFGSKWCKEGDQYEPDCVTCMDLCAEKQGISCGINLKQKKSTCCQKEKCKPHATTKQFINELLKSFGNKEGSDHRHQGVLDFETYIEGLDDMFQDGKCDEEDVIDIGQCTQDSFGELVWAKLFG